MRTLVKLTVFIALLSCSFDAFSEARYWVAPADGLWSDANNWADSFGGAGGAGVPNANDAVYFNPLCQSNCMIDISTAFAESIFIFGYDGEIDISGSNVIVDGSSINVIGSGTFKNTQAFGGFYLTTTTNLIISGGTFDIPLNLNASSIGFNGGVFNKEVQCVTTGNTTYGSVGGATFNETFTIENIGDGGFRMASTVANTYNGTVILENSGSGIIEMAFGADGCTFNCHIVVGSTGGGVTFGSNGGSSVLSDQHTFSISSMGFSSGELRLRNFTKQGVGNSSIIQSGDASFRVETGDILDGNWNVESPNILLHGATFSGATSFHKTGNSSNECRGGNIFVGNCSIKHSGSGSFLTALNAGDEFQSDLEIQNSGEGQFYFAAEASDTQVLGNLSINNSGSGTMNNFEICKEIGSSLLVHGSLVATNTSSANNADLHLSKRGKIEVVGQAILTNATSGNSGNLFVSDGSTSSSIFHSNVEITNNGTSETTQLFLGRTGDVEFNSAIQIQNNSSSEFAEIYFAQKTGSEVILGGNVTVEAAIGNVAGTYFGLNGGLTTLSDGFSISEGPTGFLKGRLYFDNFQQEGTESFVFNLGPECAFYTIESSWKGELLVNAGRIYTGHSSFAANVYFNKIGGFNDTSPGGNEFAQNTTLVHSGEDNFIMGNIDPDVFMGDVEVKNSGSGNLYLAYRSEGNKVLGDLSAVQSDQGSILSIAQNDGSSIVMEGDAEFSNESANDQSFLYLGSSGDVEINGSCTIVNNPTGNSSNIYVASTSTSDVNLNGPALVQNNGGGAQKRIFLGNSGQLSFNDVLSVKNSSNADFSIIYFGRSNGGNTSFAKNTTLEVDVSDCGGMYFSDAGGSTNMAEGAIFEIGANGYISGYLRFENFTHSGYNDVVDLELTDDAIFHTDNSAWKCNLDITAPRVFAFESEFSNNCHFTKTNDDDDYSIGGNSFEDEVTFTNDGNGIFRICDTVASTYKGDVTYIQTTNGGMIEDSRSSESSYHGDIIFNLANDHTMATNSGGGYRFVGTSDQTIYNLGTDIDFTLRNIRLQKSSGNLILDTDVHVSNEFSFTNGLVQTQNGARLIFDDNSMALTYSDVSHVNGEVLKVGNDAFEFPLGNGTYLRTISISSPSSVVAHFQAHYHNQSADPTFDLDSREIPLNHINDCEFWTLERTGPNNNVDVTLSWKDEVCTGVFEMNDLVVAGWNGSNWESHGNSVASGDLFNGSIKSAEVITDYTAFALGSTSALNALPIELLSFQASLAELSVMIEWETLTELNNDYFEVEKSANGQDWVLVEKVDGAGTSFEQLNYISKDSNPFYGISYYRLKQVDFNGDFTYSSMVSIDNNNVTDPFNIFPNPTSGDVFVFINAQLKAGSKLILLSSSGDLLEEKIVGNEFQQVEFSLNEYPAGVYIMRLFVNGKWITKRVVKK